MSAVRNLILLGLFLLLCTITYFSCSETAGTENPIAERVLQDDQELEGTEATSSQGYPPGQFLSEHPKTDPEPIPDTLMVRLVHEREEEDRDRLCGLGADQTGQPDDE